MIKIEDYFKFNRNDRIVVGCSTGPDSMALVDMLLKVRDKYNLFLIIAHVNHNVRKESFEEAEFIEKYCEEKQLNPKFDKSNNDNTYTRNKIRNVVIPYIKKEFNPNFIETITRLSEVITEENKFLKNITEQRYSEILIEEKHNQITLDLKKFNGEENVIKNRLILYTVSQLKGNTQHIHLNALEKE